MIEEAIYDHLRNPLTGEQTDPIRQDARQRFIHLAGKLVYLGRVPADQGPIAVAIRRVDGGEQYNVAGEEPTAQPVVEMLITGRDSNHGTAKHVLDVADAIRLIFSGYSGLMGSHYVQGCTVVRSTSLPPQILPDGSDRWHHAFLIDFLFTVDQAVPTY